MTAGSVGIAATYRAPLMETQKERRKRELLEAYEYVENEFEGSKE